MTRRSELAFTLERFLPSSPGPRSLLQDKLFWAILALKLAMGTFLASYYMRDLFAPFVNYFVDSGFANPWEYFADHDRLRSFPYPPIMLYLLAVPRLLFGFALPDGTDTVTAGHLFVMHLPLLAADLVIAMALAVWFPGRIRQILVYYWASPLAIYISYWHGQLDVIPTALFLVTLLMIHRGKVLLGMMVFGLSLATKHHLMVALPFLFIYLARQSNWQRAAALSVLSAGLYLLCIVPFLPDPSFQRMVFGSEEQARAFAFQLPLGLSSSALLLAPLAIALLWFRFEAYPKLNWDLFMMYLGLVFTIFIMLAPPRPGYFLWSLPFLAFYVCRTTQLRTSAYHIYAASSLAFFWLGPESDLLDAWKVALPTVARGEIPYQQLLKVLGPTGVEVFHSIIFTMMVASLAGLVLQMYLVGVRSNAVYRLRTRPIMLGLAGDSGSGKDAFCALASSALGRDRVLLISGDDYHRWPRGHEMWQVHTHLDLRGTDVHRQQSHAIALFRNEAILKGTYDHANGQFTEEKQVDPRQCIIFSGLHSLSLKAQRELYDLKIFLDPDESLRQFWKLRRDLQERGYHPHQVRKAIDARQQDREKYVLPQREHAELSISFMPLAPVDLERLDQVPDTELRVTALNSFDFKPLIDSLQKVATLTVEHEPYVNGSAQTLKTRGTISAQQVGVIAKEVIPNLDELTVTPSFLAGLQGCLQTVFLVCLSEKLRWSSATL